MTGAGHCCLSKTAHPRKNATLERERRLLKVSGGDSRITGLYRAHPAAVAGRHRANRIPRVRRIARRPCGAVFLGSRASSIGKLRHELLSTLGSHVEKSPERIHGVTGSMMQARIHRSPGQFAPPEMTDGAIVETNTSNIVSS